MAKFMRYEQCLGKSVYDESIPTPFVFIDCDVLQRNIDRMASLAKSNGVKLRPHAKTHKIAAIARMQLQSGAIGLTVAKLWEAFAFIDAGVKCSYMIAQPFFGHIKAEFMIRMQSECEFLACVSNEEIAAEIGNIAKRHGTNANIILIVDTGYRRLGVDPNRAVDVAAKIASIEGVSFRGIRSHDGRTYHLPTHEERVKAAREECEIMAEVGNKIRKVGINCDIVSIGSTPGAYWALEERWTDGITEVRPGNYVFHDRMQISLGVAGVNDCALFVVSSVVAIPRENEALIDAGLKTLSGTKDRWSEGYGIIFGKDGAKLEKLWEECGLIRYNGNKLRIGERLIIVPNHACEITNLAEVVFYGGNFQIDGFWVVEARGKVW
ncbi:MAG: alanine racemase [Armatimonadota bacterium]|nr:alanine racemase [Armatimonadota bacterium]MCX7778087.1 alanine racemase [Armatimonadota bacterium]MDW8025475.1 alanine racemase [Armatimonadota bacterium]